MLSTEGGVVLKVVIMMNALVHIPPEILLMIFCYLDCEDLFGVMPRVSSYFGDVVSMIEVVSLTAKVNLDMLETRRYELEAKTSCGMRIRGSRKPSESFFKEIGKFLTLFELNLSRSRGNRVGDEFFKVQSSFMPLFRYANGLKVFIHNGWQKKCEWNWGQHGNYSTLKELHFGNTVNRLTCYNQTMSCKVNSSGVNELNVLATNGYSINRNWGVLFRNLEKITFDFLLFDNFFYQLECLAMMFPRLRVLEINCLRCHWGMSLANRLTLILKDYFFFLHSVVLGIADECECRLFSREIKDRVVSKLNYDIAEHVKHIEVKTIQVDDSNERGYTVLSSIVVRKIEDILVVNDE